RDGFLWRAVLWLGVSRAIGSDVGLAGLGRSAVAGKIIFRFIRVGGLGCDRFIWSLVGFSLWFGFARGKRFIWFRLLQGRMGGVFEFVNALLEPFDRSEQTGAGGLRTAAVR